MLKPVQMQIASAQVLSLCPHAVSMVLTSIMGVKNLSAQQWMTAVDLTVTLIAVSCRHAADVLCSVRYAVSGARRLAIRTCCSTHCETPTAELTS